MIRILGVTKDKIVYTKPNKDGEDIIKFHHIIKSADGSYISNLKQFYEFENGFRYGVGQCYGEYIYCLLNRQLIRIDTVAETIRTIKTDASKVVFDDEYIVLMKKEERWKNYIIIPPDIKEEFFCNTFPDGADESVVF